MSQTNLLFKCSLSSVLFPFSGQICLTNTRRYPMIYETFLETVTSQLQEALGESYQFTLRPLPKNNGVTLDGLTIQSPGCSVAPTIYLNPYYERHQNGTDIKEIVQEILKLYRSTPSPSFLRSDALEHYSKLRSRIMFRLIHTASNQVLLKDLPHLPYLDLSIVFFVSLERNDAGQMSALIHREHMKRWHVTVQDLWKAASRNTPREYPAEITNMSELLHALARTRHGNSYHSDLIDELMETEDTTPLYVLTNNNGLYGASCMAYQNVLKDFADRIESDLILLPSSIHEILLTPNLPESSYEELSSMVTSINRQEVSPEEQLSNQVYLFSRKDNQIKIVSHAPELVGTACLS